MGTADLIFAGLFVIALIASILVVLMNLNDRRNRSVDQFLNNRRNRNNEEN